MKLGRQARALVYHRTEAEVVAGVAGIIIGGVLTTLQ